MTICPIHCFFMPVDFMIAIFEIADLGLHPFEDRLNFLNFHVLNGACEFLMSLLWYTADHMYEFMNVSQHVKRRHVMCSTDILKNSDRQPLVGFIMRWINV